jgi:2-hydroxychromene-2-carboxylate isomerase
MNPTVAFYFDPISPYAWLASRQLNRFQDTGARFDFKPVLFAALLDANGQRGPAEIPAKRAYIMRDVLRIASRLGIPFEGPPTHPYNPLRALRACIAVPDPEERQRFAIALMDAAWSRGLDITEEKVITTVAAGCGLDGPALVAKSVSPEVKQQLIDATQNALAAGVFGVPTFCYQNELFWGSDRLDDVLWTLQGHIVDENKLEQVLARPASATRRLSVS